MNNYKAANILVSTFNNQIDLKQVVSFVGQDLYQSGRVAARLMHMLIQENSTVVICHLDEQINNASHMQKKEKGFRKYFEELGTSTYNLLTFNTDKENLKKSLNEFLKTQHNISGIFVTTSKAFNVVEALQENNYTNIKVIGYDLLSENIKFLKSNDISFLIHQSPKAQTYFGLTYLVEHFLFNKDIPDQKLLPIDIINSENLNTYIEN